jgi:hypothetical protein
MTGKLSLFSQIYVEIGERSVQYEKAMYTEQNVKMYRNSKKEKKGKTEYCKIIV